MKKVIAVGLGSGFLATAAVFGAGTAAAAPDVVGMKYSDARKAIREAGGRAVIAVRIGDKLDDNKCIVTSISDSSYLRISRADRDEMAVALNCNYSYATAEKPGASLASPLGREAKAAAEEAAAKRRAERQAAQLEEQQLAQAQTPGA